MSGYTIDYYLQPGETPSFDEATEKAKFIAHMNDLKNMSVEESVFWKKYGEVQEYRAYGDRSSEVKARIWKPTDINNLQQTVEEIRNLKPRIFYVDPTPPKLVTSDGFEYDDFRAIGESEIYMKDWLMLRVFCHSMAYDQTPGRFLRFLIIDDVSGKYLGATSISNDVMALTCRDNFIGWTSENRCEEKMLIHSAIGSCIMGTQPFGYNFLGGKLIASLILSKHVRDTWERVVGKKLLGMTTTSLYGPNSMYCGIPYWTGCGTSMGKISLKPDDKFYDLWHSQIKKIHAVEYANKIEKADKSKGPITGIKQRILDIIFREVGVKPSAYHHGFERGVYYAPFYEQTKDFLSRKIIDQPDWTLIKRFESDSTGMINWWREKAIKRYSKLHAESRLKPDPLFYNDMIGMGYESAKAKYFNEVGR